MKIVIPTQKNNPDTNVSNVFGRAKYFALVDSKTNKLDFVENIGANSPNGAGIKAAQQVIDFKVGAVILPRIGKNGADLFEAADIKIYQQKGPTLKENIEAFNKAKLSLLGQVHAGFHGDQ